MSIKMGPDIGAPLAVTAVNLVTETIWPKYSNWFTYGMTVVGYVSAWAGWGGDMLKNVGVSSLPLTAKSIYETVRGQAPVSRSLSYKTAGRASRYPGSAPAAPFAGVKLV